MSNETKTALVTGANSGIGFEAAAQLAEAGYDRVILGTRSAEKAQTAEQQLIERTGYDVFEGVTIDTSETESASRAVNDLIARDIRVDVLILNAGMTTAGTPTYNSNGVELTFASTLIGHHALVMRLLAENRLTEHARIIIAGSEAARGNIPGMSMPDFHALANEYFDGSLEAALEAIARIEPPYKYAGMGTYAVAKVYVAWWAAALAQKLPQGMAVNAVSPGSVPATNFTRDMSFPMRFLMGTVMPAVGPLFGMAASVGVGAKRYLDVAAYGDSVTGKFYASPPGKMTGKLQEQGEPIFADVAAQEATFNVISRLAGIGFPVAEGSV